MTHRVNVILEDETWKQLSKAPRGERSRIVNRALTAWFHDRRRRDAARRMDEMRQRMPEVSTGEILDWLRQDRDREA